MSKIINDGLTRSGTGSCFIAVPIWQQWASKGLRNGVYVLSTTSQSARLEREIVASSIEQWE